MRDDTRDRADAVREQILREARDLFAHFGFNKTNIGDIADRCGMSPGNLYRYFRNKQAIGLAVVRQYFDMCEVTMATPLMLPGSPEERLRGMILSGVGDLVREMHANPMIVELADFLCSDEEGRKVLQAHIAWKIERIAAEIARGIETGDFAPGDPAELARAVLMACKSFWVPPMLAGWDDPDEIMPDLNRVLDLLFAGLARRDR